MSQEDHIDNLEIETKINPSAPLDAPIAALIQDARDDNRGFALNVAAELKDGVKTIVHRVEQVLPPVDNREAPTPYRKHSIEDADSLVAYATKYGTAKNSLVVYNNKAITLCLNELEKAEQREKITLTFAYSQEWSAWARMFGNTAHDHRTLLTHLIMFQHTLLDVTILDRMRTIKATFEAKLDSDLQLANETVGVVFKATAGDELVKFPREFVITLPVLDLDVDSVQAWQKVKVRVEVQLPTEPKQPVRFQLIAPELNAVQRRRINAEIQVIKQGLPEWTVVRGEHAELARVVGRK